jgi:hypothetical protein
MCDCNELRAALGSEWGRGCCEHCHGRDELHFVRFRGRFLQLCCLALSEAIRAGAIFQPEDDDPLPSPPRMPAAGRYPDSGVMRAWG